MNAWINHLRCTAFIAIFLVSIGPAGAVDQCSDEYMSNQIQPEARAASSAVGVCGTARAGIRLYEKSIRLIDKCLHIPSLRAYKSELQSLLSQARSQAASSCS